MAATGFDSAACVACLGPLAVVDGPLRRRPQSQAGQDSVGRLSLPALYTGAVPASGGPRGPVSLPRPVVPRHSRREFLVKIFGCDYRSIFVFI